MYKGFFEDVEYVMGLFFRPFEDCCKEDDDKDEDEEKKCGIACDEAPCFRHEDEDDEDKEEGKACDCLPCMRNDDSEDIGDEEPERRGGIMDPGPVQEILKCLFDASDVDYDYED